MTVLARELPGTGVMAAFNQLAPPPVTEVVAVSWAKLPVPMFCTRKVCACDADPPAPAWKVRPVCETNRLAPNPPMMSCAWIAVDTLP